MNPTMSYAILTASILFIIIDALTYPDIVSNKTHNYEEIYKTTEDPKIYLDLVNHNLLNKKVNEEFKRFKDQLFQKSNVSVNMINQNDFKEIWKYLQDFLLYIEENKEVGNEREDKETKQKIIREHLHEGVSESITTVNSFADLLLFSEDVTNDNQKTSEQRNPRKISVKTNESVLEDESFRDSFLDLPALVQKLGYNVQEYTVQTEDGYLLGLHRMWKTSKKRGDPVLLMHGLLLSSDCWLGAGPEFGLAYLLAQDGYDVWIGNVRGNHYSRGHVTLDPDSSSYWQFCTDEHGKYDLPAMIDKVSNETGAEKLNYLGYSQGGGMYLIMCSELPHYCSKANVAILLSPSGRHLLTKSFAFRFLCVFYEENEKVLHDAGIYDVLPRHGHLQRFCNFFCRKSDLTLQICKLIKDILDSHHPGSFTRASILKLVSNFPSGTSVHNMARFGQSLRSRNIYKFNYGLKKNLELYGSPKPPKYNLSATSVPVVVIYGRNDGIVDIDDVKWLIRQLPNVVDAYEVQDPLWTHLDGPYSQHVPRLLYPKIKEHLNKLDRE